MTHLFHFGGSAGLAKYRGENSWRGGTGRYFSRQNSWRDGTGFCFFRGGTGRLLFFSEAGRGGRFFFPKRDGVVVVFFRGGTGRLYFFSEAGRGGCSFFSRRDGAGWLCFSRQEPLGSTATRAMFSHACQPQRQQHLMCQMVLAAAAPAAAAATVMGLLPLHNCGGWPASLFGCGFKYASITAKHRLRGGVLVSVWERLHQPKTKN